MNNSTSLNIGFYDDTFFLSVFITEGIIIIPTIFGNLLLVYSIIRFRTLHKRSYILICNLALSDLLFGLLFIPYDMISFVVPEVRQNKLTCLLREFLLLGLVGGSVMNMLVISIERYTAIKYPLWHFKLSQKCLVIPISFSWLTSIFIAVLPLFGWNSWNTTLKCTYQWIDALNPKFLTLWLSINVIAVFISFAMFIAVFVTISAIVNKRNSITNPLMHRTSVHGLRSSFEKTKLFTLILGVFAFCWGPYSITVSLKPLFPSERENFSRVLKYSSLLAISNSGINWIILGLRNKRIRHAIKTTLSPFKRWAFQTQYDTSLHQLRSVSSVS